MKASRFFKYAFLIAVSLLSAFPFYWMLVSSTNPTTQIIQSKLTPGNHLIENFKALSASGKLTYSFRNSVWYSTVTTLCALFVSSLAGYGFITYKDRGKGFALTLILLSMMIPAAATLIPLFRLFGQMKLVNTFVGFMLPSVATAFLIFMFYQSAQSFPQELVQAARIDGLGELNIFLRVFVPVMRPTYAAAATITFMNSWNSYLWPLVILNNPQRGTMSLMIPTLMDAYVLDYGQIMLAVTITTIPTMLIFFILQKNFVEGILGSLK